MLLFTAHEMMTNMHQDWTISFGMKICGQYILTWKVFLNVFYEYIYILVQAKHIHSAQII